MADETKDKTTEEENDQVEETSEASEEEEEEVESSEASEESEESEASEEEGSDEDVADDSDEDAEEDEDAEDADAEDAEEEADEDEVSEASEEDDDSDEDEDEADDEDDSEEAEAEFADDSDEDEDLEEDEDEDGEEEEDLFDVEPSEADEADEEDEEEGDEDEDLDDPDESDDDITLHTVSDVTHEDDSAVDDRGEQIDGLAAYFDYPAELLHAGEVARDSDFEKWDLFSPFPIHGFEESMGIGRSWLPWVTFVAGGTGFLTANAIQFGMLTFDWPMIIGGKPHAPWPSFVPIMFELTVLIGGVTTALVMLIASGCFRKPRIIDPEITNDRFVLWIDAQDPNFDQARAFMEELDPVEIRPVTFDS